jgi:uncharacterized membrane protein (DUF373 family)
MPFYKEIKAHYFFTSADARRLLSVQQLMIDHADRIMNAIDEWIQTLPEARRLFSEESRKAHVKALRRQWFSDLFSGIYDAKYFDRLARIGQMHVKTGVKAHFLNRTINLVRNACIEILNQNIEDADERAKIAVSLHKILDINLDIITSSFIEEEIRSYSEAYRVQEALIKYAETFAHVMNLILVLALVGLSLGVVWLFIQDLSGLIGQGDFAHNIITALGSLLVLWVMIELMNTEIKHLKGAKFRISVFVGVALVASIRDTMIKALRHDNMQEMYYLIPLILTLGVVFWLVTKSEERNI